MQKTKYIPRPKSRELRFLINQNHLKPLGATIRKERYNSMGEIELKFNFDTESRGALFAPRQSYNIRYLRPSLAKLSEGADGVHRGIPYAPFLRNSLGSAKELHNRSYR